MKTEKISEIEAFSREEIIEQTEQLHVDALEKIKLAGLDDEANLIMSLAITVGVAHFMQEKSVNELVIITRNPKEVRKILTSTTLRPS